MKYGSSCLRGTFTASLHGGSEVEPKLLIFTEQIVTLLCCCVVVNRETACVEMSGILTAVSEMSGILLQLREMSEK